MEAEREVGPEVEESMRDGKKNARQESELKTVWLVGWVGKMVCERVDGVGVRVD